MSLRADHTQYLEDGTLRQLGSVEDDAAQTTTDNAISTPDGRSKPSQKDERKARWMSSKDKWAKRRSKIQLYPLRYDDAELHTIFRYAVVNQWQQWGANPYNLPPLYYLIIFACLAAWAIGSIVCGHYEAQAKLEARDISNVLPTLCRGLIGAIPALTQITLFLFPPLYVPTGFHALMDPLLRRLPEDHIANIIQCCRMVVTTALGFVTVQ